MKGWARRAAATGADAARTGEAEPTISEIFRENF
jgi:hypothetical protein